VDAPPVNCVTSDWAGATRSAVQHLVGLGHHRLAADFAADLRSSSNSTSLDHERGWLDGLATCELDPAEQSLLRLETGEAEENRKVIGKLLSGDAPGRSRPTAVICSNDFRA